MNYPSDPSSHGYTLDYDLNHQYPSVEWNTLDGFLEWQRDQTETSPPESITTSTDGHYCQHNAARPPPISYNWGYSTPSGLPNVTPNSEFPPDMSHPQRPQVSRGSTPGVVSPPHSLPDDYMLYADELGLDVNKMMPESFPAQTENPGPQLPKIGRPRSTPSNVQEGGEEGTNAGGKAPGQARRRSQNREAQRAFRARQRQYIEQLARENKELTYKNKELERRCEMLARGYRKSTSGKFPTAPPNQGVRGDVHFTEEHVDGSTANVTGSFGMPWNLVGARNESGGKPS